MQLSVPSAKRQTLTHKHARTHTILYNAQSPFPARSVVPRMCAALVPSGSGTHPASGSTQQYGLHVLHYTRHATPRCTDDLEGFERALPEHVNDKRGQSDFTTLVPKPRSFFTFAFFEQIFIFNFKNTLKT